MTLWILVFIEYCRFSLFLYWE